MDRFQIQRMYQIHLELERGTYPNHPRLAEKLEVHERTVKRDMDFLRDRLQAPLEFDRKRNGWYYQEPFRFPFPQLSQGETLALLFGLNLLSQCRGLGLERAAASLLGKLPEILPEGVSLDEGTLQQGVSFSLEPLRGDQEKVAEYSASLQEAIAQHRRVEFSYYTPARDEVKGRLLDPYHLQYFQGAWYLVGFCHWRKEVRTFAVDRIQGPPLLTKVRFAPVEFSPRDYFGDSWRLERGREAARVVVRLSPVLARWLKGRQYHHSQETVEGEDGSLTYAFKVRGLAEIKRWILQFGAEVEVLEPPQLRAEMAEEGIRLTRLHGG